MLTSCLDRISAQSNKLRVENRIFDYAELLTTVQEDSIFQIIKNLDTEIGSQIGIVTINSLEGHSIEEYSLKFADSLGLGRTEFDDGILITVSVSDRMMRIEVGYGLERIIKDEIASRINREEMAPSFQENDFAGGLTKAVLKIKKLIEDNKELVGIRP